ncbi:hypothetical protein BSP7_050 [Bacillus phage BSP7]|nr:hypothetical protein BSP7_050 [Bacillus phage BSP7]
MNYTVADLIFYKAFGKIKEYRHTNGRENKQVTKLQDRLSANIKLERGQLHCIQTDLEKCP